MAAWHQQVLLLGSIGRMASCWKLHQERGNPWETCNKASQELHDTDNPVPEKRCLLLHNLLHWHTVQIHYRLLWLQKHSSFPINEYRKNSSHLSLLNTVNATSQALLGQLPILTSFGRRKPVDNGLLCGLPLQKFTSTLICSHTSSQSLFSKLSGHCVRGSSYLANWVSWYNSKLYFFLRKTNGSLMKLAKSHLRPLCS